MTTNNQPHKYRCETCKERFDSEHIEYLHERCPMSVWLNTHLKLELLYSHIGVKILWLITSIVGCASHSDAGKAEQPCKHAEMICHSPYKCDYQDFADISDADHPRCSKPFASKAEQRIADVIAELEKRKEHYYKQSCRHDTPPKKRIGS